MPSTIHGRSRLLPLRCSRRPDTVADNTKESFTAHIALQPIEGQPFSLPLLADQECEFETFDHLDHAIVSSKAVFDLVVGNLTIAIFDFPELQTEGSEMKVPTQCRHAVLQR